MKKMIMAMLLTAGLIGTAVFAGGMSARADVASPSDYPKEGWVEEGAGWQYIRNDGTLMENGIYEIEVDGEYHKYIFDSAGILQKGFVDESDDPDSRYSELNLTDTVLTTEFYCGPADAEGYKNNYVRTGWFEYKEKYGNLVENPQYDDLDELWLYYDPSNNGRKVEGTSKTISGREYDFDICGIMIPGDLHVNYYSSKDITDHHVSEFYNSGAEDCKFQRPWPRHLKDFPEDKYTFLYWEDEAGIQYKIGDVIETDMDVYGVWQEIGKEEEKKDESKQDDSKQDDSKQDDSKQDDSKQDDSKQDDSGKQGGTTHAANTSGNSSNRNEISTNTATYGVGGYVTTSSQSGMAVGSDVSGPYTSGRWQQSADGTWNFRDVTGKDYKDEWAYVYTPYASSAEKARWFAFDENGKMRTGWFTDKDGRRYYLNPDPQKGVEGEMMTGWVEIEGVWYYFNPNPDGTRGSLVRSAARPE